MPLKRPRFNLKNAKSRKATLIVMRWRYPDARGGYSLVTLSSSQFITPKDWDPVYMRVRVRCGQGGQGERINDCLDWMEWAAMEVLRKYGPGMEVARVKKLIEAEVYGDMEKAKTLLHLCDAFIEEKRKAPDAGPSAVENIGKLRTRIKAWRPEQAISDLGDDTAYDFRIHLFEAGFSSGYIQKLMSLFRGLLNFGLRAGALERNFWSGSPAWRQKAARPSKIALNPEEWQCLAGSQLLDKRLEEARRVFVAQGFSGLRFSDVYKLNTSPVRQSPAGPVMEIRTQKTGKAVMIAATQELQDVLPLARLHNQTYNRRLKRIGQALELDREIRLEKLTMKRNEKGNYTQATTYETIALHQVLASHAARRTWALLNYVNGVQVRYIQTVLGHASEKQTLVYIGMENLDPESMAMQALREVRRKDGGLKAI